jgi:hypothetical protein
MGGKTTTSTSEPWAPAQGALTSTLADAGKLYQHGIGGSIWSGPTNAPFASQQTAGLNHMENTARAMTPWMGKASERLDGIANAGPSYAERNLADAASGKLLSGGDPHFEEALGAAGQRTQDAVNLQASQMGRMGSGANYGTVAREVGNIQTQARSDQYNRERGYQMNANQMLDAERQAGLANRLAAFDRMPAAFDQAMLPGQALFDVGARYQGQAQNVLDDQIRMFDAAQSAPWAQLGRYNAIAQGTGGLGGTQTQRESGFGLGDLLGLLKAF